MRQAVPALLGGMEANAQDPGGAASLEKALGQHAGSPFEGLDLGQVDTADGEKIVGNIFGDNSEQVINKLGGDSGGSGMMQKLLPILAPIVLSMLAGKFLGQGQGQAAPGQASGPMPSGGSAGGLEDLLGSAGAAGEPLAQPAASVTCSEGCLAAVVGPEARRMRSATSSVGCSEAVTRADAEVRPAIPPAR